MQGEHNVRSDWLLKRLCRGAANLHLGNPVPNETMGWELSCVSLPDNTHPDREHRHTHTQNTDTPTHRTQTHPHTEHRTQNTDTPTHRQTHPRVQLVVLVHENTSISIDLNTRRREICTQTQAKTNASERNTDP